MSIFVEVGLMASFLYSLVETLSLVLLATLVRMSLS